MLAHLVQDEPCPLDVALARNQWVNVWTKIRAGGSGRRGSVMVLSISLDPDAILVQIWNDCALSPEAVRPRK